MNEDAGKETAVSPEAPHTPFWWKQTNAPACAAPVLRPGDGCPTCGQGTLAYDGLFNLACNRCQTVASSGAFT